MMASVMVRHSIRDPAMEKTDFHADTRYTIAWQQPDGRVVPATIYVHRVHDPFMIVRVAGNGSELRKIGYAEVLRIVEAEPASPEELRPVPAALLDEKSWQGRTVLAHYASSPARGK